MIRPHTLVKPRLGKRLRHDRRGATAIEYGLILSLIAIAILGSLNSLGTATTGLFANVGAKISKATGN